MIEDQFAFVPRSATIAAVEFVVRLAVVARLPHSPDLRGDRFVELDLRPQAEPISLPVFFVAGCTII